MAKEIRFDGFSTFGKQQLIAAFIVMRTASAKARMALMSGDLAAYTKWFDGTGRNKHLMKVASIIKEIDDAINKRSITFANATGNTVHKKTGGLCGYVGMIHNKGPGDDFASDIHIGSGMRVLIVPKSHHDDNYDLAETMYHELSHKVGGTHDVTYDVAICLENARKQPHNAVLNAENYNRFLGEFIS